MFPVSFISVIFLLVGVSPAKRGVTLHKYLQGFSVLCHLASIIILSFSITFAVDIIYICPQVYIFKKRKAIL
jgi:hypothetical protein